MSTSDILGTAIAGVMLALPLGNSAAVEPLHTLVPGTLRIGTYFVNPPFEYAAKDANVGFEVDLMEEIVRRLGLQPVFVNTHWEKILEEMQGGRYDCIVGGITITPEREHILAWSVPYNDYVAEPGGQPCENARDPQRRGHEGGVGWRAGKPRITTRRS